MVAQITCSACGVGVRPEAADASESRVRNGDGSIGWAPDPAEPRGLDKIRLARVEIGRLDVVKVSRRIGRGRRRQKVQHAEIELNSGRIYRIGRLALRELCNRKDQQRCTANEKNRYCLLHLSSPVV